MDVFGFNKQRRCPMLAVFTWIFLFNQIQSLISASPPILRCNQPTFSIIASTQSTRTNGSLLTSPALAVGTSYDPQLGQSTSNFNVPVASNISLLLSSSDTDSSKTLTIRQKADPGLPSGSIWSAPSCLGNGGTTCNVVQRMFTFSALPYHGGQNISMCFEAVNDQTQCVSQSLCVSMHVSSLHMSWTSATPAEGSHLQAYSGCPLSVELAAEDPANMLDIHLSARTVDHPLPAGAVFGPLVCRSPGPSADMGVTGQPQGPAGCSSASRTFTWTPSRAQSGMQVDLCFEARARYGGQYLRCFSVSVGKCRYCAGAGDTLASMGESIGTDWLQLWGANPQIGNPNKLQALQQVNLGVLYAARQDDTLAALADKFQASLQALLAVNPQIASGDTRLSSTDSVCVLPSACDMQE